MSGEASRREGPGRPRDPAADAAILRAALDQLIDRGVEHTSMENVAKRAGVAKMTVYRRWPSKEELLADAIEAAREDIPNASVDTYPAADLPQTIERLLPRWGAVLAEPRFRALTVRLLGAGSSHPSLLAAYWHHHVLPRRERAARTLEAAIEAGILAPDTDIEVLLDMLTGAVIHNLLLNPTPREPAEISDYLRRLLGQAGFPVRS